MNIKCLIGLELDGCRFSKGSYTLDFSGKIENKSKGFQICTSYNISSVSKRKDVYEQISSFLWPFLDLRLAEIVENKDALEVLFVFENGEAFVIWADDEIDSLMVVEDVDTGKCFFVL
jgi:hypothetical protein